MVIDTLFQEEQASTVGRYQEVREVHVCFFVMEAASADRFGGPGLAVKRNWESGESLSLILNHRTIETQLGIIALITTEVENHRPSRSRWLGRIVTWKTVDMQECWDCPGKEQIRFRSDPVVTDSTDHM